MRRAWRLLVAGLAAWPLLAVGAAPADAIYRNGHVYTADADDSVRQALAIRGGRIVYVGDDAGVAAFAGPRTVQVDLAGRTVMPGLIDGHMHPLEGGARLLKCSLDYAILTVAQFQQRIRSCLDAAPDAAPDAWLEVVSWFQQAMLPAGVPVTRSTLDALGTTRPVAVRDAFGHTTLVNGRALALAHITRDTPDPPGGAIEHGADGEPSGLLQDAGSGPVDALLPPLTDAQARAAARAALAAMARQGVTSFLDASTDTQTLAAFASVQRAHGLTARAHFAPVIEPAAAADPHRAVAAVLALRRRFDQGPERRSPTITVRNAKLYLDGVIAGPAFTGAMLEPYLVDRGAGQAPRWVAGPSRGPEPYFAPAPLAAVLRALAGAGIDPHLHVDGDRAVRAALDAVAAMRAAYPGADIRPGLAHCEIVAPEDFPRFAQLQAFPVLSMQWEKPAPDTVDQLRDYLGPRRAAILEPAGLLAAAGAPVAFGSDWPVDALDEWFALKVGMTRTNSPAMSAKYPGRLGDDPGLGRLQVLRAATITAARELHLDRVTGSLEAGKFADLIVLDQDPLSIEPERIAGVKVLRTVVGGRIVHDDARAWQTH